MKKTPFLTTCILLSSLFSFAQSYADLIRQAKSFYESKEYNKSIELYQKAFDLEKSNSSDLYDAACSAALAGKKETAFDLLNLSVNNGWTNIYHLNEDRDLATLHDEEQWDITVRKLQTIVDKIEANYDKPLQKELLDIYKNDQDIRREYLDSAGKLGYNNPVLDSLGEVMYLKDSINLEKVTRILDTKGWVGKDKVGQRANSTLFLVIQHSELEVQKKYLPILRDAVKKGDAANTALALLEDRVALGEGKRQIYGSQIGRDPATEKFYVLPLEDPDSVDKKRADLGLEPLAEYVKRWNIIWNIEEYKKQLPEIEKLSKEN